MFRCGHLALFLFFAAFCAHSQQSDHPGFSQGIKGYFQGNWSGDLRFDGCHLPLSFELDGQTAIFYNPVQSPQKATMDSVVYKDSILQLYIQQLSFSFRPSTENLAKASMKEGGEIIPFQLIRNRDISPPDRPQHPDTLVDYLIEEVTFVNTDANILLSGTLTLPRHHPSACVILLTGSGPQDRDETLMHHKPFAVLADFFTRLGLGVLRYDDRGVAKSEGSHNTATSYNFAEDAAAAFDFVKSKFPNTKVGFLGHSEGGMIAQVADSLVRGADFHIYLAGPGLNIIDLMIEQNREVLKASIDEAPLEVYLKGLRPIFEIITSPENIEDRQSMLNESALQLYRSLPSEASKTLAPSDVVYAMSVSQLLYLKWWPYFLGYQPKQYLSQITCPILALNGSRDIQVTPKNLEAIQIFADKAKVRVIVLEEHNHLFQECTHCNLREYGMLTQTLSPTTLTTIQKWLKEQDIIAH